MRSGDTMFLATADGNGMGVGLIQSNAADFGAHLVEPRTGIFLHNRGIGFSLEPAHPAEYGPRRRPPSTLSPAVITRPDGTLRTVLGTMGGDSQPQILLQLVVRLLRHGQPPGTAVRAPRWVLANHESAIGFSTWRDPAALGVDLEADVPPAWVDGLVARGHLVRVRGRLDLGFGHAHVIEHTGSGWAGAADPRAGHGAALGR
jgi:gamma-glutamyltranspeptidase/glutathione hydrolase